jgi:glycosyltransferase involved in cell wall biosynthesis
MKFSIITPEHNKNNPYLMELFESIENQTYENWEWVILLNNGCEFEDLPEQILYHDKVNVYKLEETNSNIGFIKNKAFHLGSGDVLVEVDHDDILIENCLEKLYEVYQDENMGFVYSDNAVLHMTDEFSPYDANQGWEYSIYNWKGRDLISMKSFEPSSQSLGYIWYAPDHVRSWRSNVYKEIGGHNPELSVCDDHELCIRTYLHTKMKRIPEVLYIYRITGENTWLERNQEIQQKTIELFNNYIQLLAEKDCEEKGLLKIDLGGGLNPYKDYKTVDITESADFQYDLNEGIPLPDNSVGVINASHILEHLKDPIKSMSEIHRVLCHGGWAFIEIPSTDGRGAFQDPTHVSFWNENSFLYYTDKYLANFINNKYIRFQEYYKQTYFPNEWLQQINVCVTSAYLTVIKDDSIRYPGFLKI